MSKFSVFYFIGYPYAYLCMSRKDINKEVLKNEISITLLSDFLIFLNVTDLTEKHLSVIQGRRTWVWGVSAPPICAKNIEERTDTGINGQFITSLPFKSFNLPPALCQMK